MAEFGDLGGQTDNEADEEQQAAGQGSAIRGGLLNPSTFPSIMPSGSDRLAIAPQPAIFSGSLDRDVHAEVLQDILDAQARN